MNNINLESLVSIIMPAYNCQDFILEAIDSVQKQIYKNWELIIIDDCSTDDTPSIVKNVATLENRVHYLRMDKNSGAAVARNQGVKMAKGEFIAFLDSDDVWNSKKLSHQISFMHSNNVNFSCTSYNKIDEYGNRLNQIIHSKSKSSYKDLLKNNCGNSTVIYNCRKIGKIYIPNIKKRNDYVMWLQILKKEKYLYGIDEVLCSHRIRANSLSENKISLIKYHWLVYRDIEHLPFTHSVYLILYWMVKTLKNKIQIV